VRAFASPDPAVIAAFGEDVLFRPAAGGEYAVRLVVSQNAVDPAVQPPPILVLFGTMLDSGFLDVDAPKPVRGDSLELDDVSYGIYVVKEDRAGGTPDTNGFWLYLTQTD
jgi:hypothetical protein